MIIQDSNCIDFKISISFQIPQGHKKHLQNRRTDGWTEKNSVLLISGPIKLKCMGFPVNYCLCDVSFCFKIFSFILPLIVFP